MSVQVQHIRFRVRGRLAAEWASLNEVLLERELGFETDTGKAKLGTGITPWNDLAYLPGGASLPDGGTEGQVLAKASSANQDVEWVDQTGGGGGGVIEIQAGVNVSVDATDPARPVVSATGAGAPGPPGPAGPEGPRGGGIITDTKALLHFDGPNGSTSFVDETGSRVWAAVGGAQIDTGASKFGPSSLYLPPGTNARIQAPYDPGFSILGDFTSEIWMRRESATRNTFFHHGGVSTAGWYAAVLANGSVQGVFGGGGGYQVIGPTASGSVPVGVWTHVAVVKAGLTVRIFVNGVLLVSAALSGVVDSTANFIIGREGSDSSRDFTGHLDEFKFSNAAKYVSGFTPPAAPFSFPVGPQLPVFSIPNLPEVSSNAYVMIYVPNLAGGAEPCVSDGTDWRRLSDRSIAS